MECEHVIGSIRNPLPGREPVTITVKDRSAIIEMLIGNMYYFAKQCMDEFDTCPQCKEEIELLWRKIHQEVGVITTKNISPWMQ
jgi:uncharacterized protein with PIN domain